MTDRRRNIVHVLYRFDTGGLENGVVNLINHLPASEFRHFVVAVTQCVPAFCDRIKQTDVDFIDINKPSGHAFKLYPRLYKLFKTLAPDVLHTRGLAALETVVPARLAGIRSIVHGEHGWDHLDPGGASRKHQLIRRFYRPCVDAYVALSGQIEHYLTQRVGISQRLIQRIGNGVDTERFVPRLDSRALLQGGRFNESRFLVIGTVGRLQAVKDQLNLVRAFALLTQKAPDYARQLRLMIVGEGPLRPALTQEIQHLQLGDRVWLAGERADIPEVMRAMDLFVLPSRAEGISNTILEAMASGLPVVATRGGGNPELIKDRVTGVLVPPDDSSALADGMLRYVRDPDLRREHGVAARLRVETEFSLEVMLARYRKLYLDISAPGGSV